MAIFHLNAKTGTRAGGQSAGAKAAYNLREEKYAKHPDAVDYDESGNMPGWAAPNPLDYWKAADAGERANGRLFKEVEFALPRELTIPQQRALAHAFAVHLTGEERLPYTLTIHEGRGENPHAHLLISERMNDGIEREPGTWFRRFNAKDPAKGGAQKTEALKPREWLEETRAAWAAYANRALELAGHDARIDHRSLEDQGVNRLPTSHLGPTATAMARRGEQVDRERPAFDQVQGQGGDRKEQITEAMNGLAALLNAPHPLHEERVAATAPVGDALRRKDEAELQYTRAEWKAEQAGEAFAAFEGLSWVQRRLRAGEGNELAAALEQARMELAAAEQRATAAERELKKAQRLQDERFHELDSRPESVGFERFKAEVRADLETLGHELQAILDAEQIPEQIQTSEIAPEIPETQNPAPRVQEQNKAPEKAPEREEESSPSPSPWDMNMTPWN